MSPATLQDVVASLNAPELESAWQDDTTLGWVYQFWQSKKKDEVNASGNKIGADELPSVTQLFTEDYMVDFLLDNTLGAWYAGKVLATKPALAENGQSEEELRNAVSLPGCPWNYLRFIKAGDANWRPAAGTFDGAIEHLEDTGINDVVVVVRGPDADMIVRKKDRIAGIFLNRDQARLQGMPSYYFIASTRPVDKIAASYTLQRYAIGLNNIIQESFRSHHDPEPFRLALIAHKQHDGLYGETQSGVELLSPTLFRARIPVPATVPRGQYNVEVYLFRDGTVISAQSTPLFVDQIGLERRLFNMAHNQPLLYGLATVLMAVFLGWLSSLVFRQI